MKRLYARFKQSDRDKKIIYIFVAAIFATMAAWCVQQFIRVAVLDYTFFNGTTWGANESDYWMDFFNVNFWTQKNFNPYTSDFRSSYPPLILVISKLFSFLANYSHGSPYASNSFLGIFSYHLVFLGFTALSFMAWLRCMKDRGIEKKPRICVAVALLLTAPYLYLYGRGNYIVIVVTCISWFLAWYKSEKRWQREVALVLLAIAAGIKLYPALLAAILLKERRFADFFKTVIYTIAAFFLPFLVFTGGFSNIGVFLENLTSFQGADQVSDRNYSMPTFLYYFVQFANGLKLGGIPQWVITVGGKLASAILLCGLFFSLFAKRTWKALALITIALIVYPAPSFIYSATMMLPVILAFLICGEKRKLDYAYLFFFLVMLIPVQFGYLVSPDFFPYGLSVNNFLQHFAMIIVFCMLLCESVINLFRLCARKTSGYIQKRRDLKGE